MNRICYTLLLLLLGVSARALPLADAEFFLEINTAGKYTVYIDDQFAGSSGGRFRFFDLPAGRSLLAIEYNGRQVLREYVDLRPGTRTLAAYRSGGGLLVSNTIPLYRDGRYCLDSWNGDDRRPGGRPELYGRNAMSESDFGEFLNTLQREPFKDGKDKLMKMLIKTGSVTVQQLSVLLKQVPFDDDRLALLRFAYPYINDPGNYYRLREKLSFLSARESFDHFLLSH